MPYAAVFVALAGAASAPAATCARYVVHPASAQASSDAALVRSAAHADVSAGSVSFVMSSGGWRVVWATPDGGEPGVFFFRARRGSPRFADVWGGPTSDERGAFRWAATVVGAPAPLAHCFAARLVTVGP